jgi:DNA-binding NarL/FixJ family response regulator
MERTTFLSAVGERPVQDEVTSQKERQPGYASVLLAPNVDDLFDRLSQHGRTELPNVDIQVPDSQRDEIVQHIRACYPDVLIAVVTECEDHHSMMHIVGGEAHGRPARTALPAQPHPALHVVAEQGQFAYEVEQTPSPAPELDDALLGLTHRQQQVIRLLTRGYSNKIIARELGISPSTVKVHVHAAFRALGVHSRMAAAAVLRHASLSSFNSA